jgi:predicted neutral ceramidase superfamily lipid hydrolase
MLNSQWPPKAMSPEAKQLCSALIIAFSVYTVLASIVYINNTGTPWWILCMPLIIIVILPVILMLILMALAFSSVVIIGLVGAICCIFISKDSGEQRN